MITLLDSVSVLRDLFIYIKDVINTHLNRILYIFCASILWQKVKSCLATIARLVYVVGCRRKVIL
jgi:hypothetical protein